MDNRDDLGRVRLNLLGTLKSIEVARTRLEIGLRVVLVDPGGQRSVEATLVELTSDGWVASPDDGAEAG